MTGISRNTTMNLGVRVGQGCAKILDQKMRNLSSQQAQFVEIGGFIGKKERHVARVTSPERAVRAAIIKEFRDAQEVQEGR